MALLDDFHFCRAFRGDQDTVSRQRHKHYLFSRLRLKPGMAVLDVGCGSGSAALELALFASVHVFGIDTDNAKILEATRRAKVRGISNSVTFIHVPRLESAHNHFSAASLDAIYSIESLRVITNVPQSYANLCSLLKPGGKLALYEWCWTDSFSPANPDHVRLAELLEVQGILGSGSSIERTPTAMVAALRSVPLSDVYCDDLSRTVSKASIPWYHVVDKALSDGRTSWADGYGKAGTLGHLTREAATVISEAGHIELFTPMALLVGTRV